MISRQGYAETVDIFENAPFGALLALFFALFRIFSHFFRIFFRFLKSLWFFSRFFSVFHRFLNDLEKILEGFWEDFSMIFRTIMENCDFVKNVVFPP